MTEDQFINFLAKINVTDSCWEWEGARINGYGIIRQNKRNFRAHIISYQLCHGPVPEGLKILHSCDNPCCVNPAHLRAGTQKENIQEAVQKGRIAVGEDNRLSKLSNAERRQVRDLAKCGLFHLKDIGEWYGIKAPTVCQIKYGTRGGSV